MDDISRSVRGLVSLLEQGTLSLSVWNVYLEKIEDASLKELALRLRSSLEYATATKQLKGLVKANYRGAITAWQQRPFDNVTKAGNELIAAAEKYIKQHAISIV